MITVFSFDGTATSFHSLAKAIDGTLEEEALVIDKEEIKGIVKRTELEHGLYLLYCKISILKDYIFINKCCQSDRNAYFLTYFFEAQFDHISLNGEKKLTYKRDHSCTTLHANTHDVEYVYKAGKSIDCLCIVFTNSWLKEQVEASQHQNELKNSFLTKLHASYVSATSATEQVLADRLAGEFDKNPSMLFVKAYTYNLLNTFINYSVSSGSIVSTSKPYMEMMVEVERKIRSSLTGKLPGIEQLASEFYISSSTLKRQFKRFYGKGLYEYYLFQKMQLAKEILEQGSLTVTDAAAALGYENVSHFIELFKKHFGCSPNKISKGKKEK